MTQSNTNKLKGAGYVHYRKEMGDHAAQPGEVPELQQMSPMGYRLFRKVTYKKDPNSPFDDEKFVPVGDMKFTRDKWGFRLGFTNRDGTWEELFAFHPDSKKAKAAFAHAMEIELQAWKYDREGSHTDTE